MSMRQHQDTYIQLCLRRRERERRGDKAHDRKDNEQADKEENGGT